MSDNRGVPVVVTGGEPRKVEAEKLLKALGVDPTPDRITLALQMIQNITTTIHTRPADPYLPDADNIRQWEMLRPGTANEVMGLISSVTNQSNEDSHAINSVRRSNERRGFQVSALIALGSIPVAIGASLLGVPVPVDVAIIVMGIGGPTAASFFSNWLGVKNTPIE